MDLKATQAFMKASGFDAWLLYDFRGSNFVLGSLLPKAGPPGGTRFTTRRVYLLVPASGEPPPTLLVHSIDKSQFDDVAAAGVRRDVYLSWQEMREKLGVLLKGKKRVAMEYAPECSLPVVSIADAGTVELVRGMGVEVVSSADVIQTAAAVWGAEAVKEHAKASEQVAGVKDFAFQLIRDSLAAGKAITEHEVAEQMRGRFKAAGLEWPDGPIVAVNEHSGDPHFEPTAANSVKIKKGDWVLIDLWARRPGNSNIYSDITWVGYCGAKVPAKHAEVFAVVKAARDASLARAQKGWEAKEAVEGWMLDDAARKVIIDAGYGKFIRHRTGHSLSAGAMVHGIGMNLDNLETHDTRRMLPGIGFTIEPGVYLPEFGVREEINVYVDPAKGPVVTSCVQSDVVLLA